MPLACIVRQHLQEQGFALIRDFTTAQQLEELRRESEILYELAAEGFHKDAGPWGAADSTSSCIYEGIPAPLCTPAARAGYDAYKLARTRLPLGPGVWQIVFQSQLPELVLALLGPDAVLYNDQYIIKPPLSPLSAFPWHRDSDWCCSAEVHYQPYISIWVALDDMSPENGCFVVRPGSHLQQPGPHSPPQAAPGCDASSCMKGSSPAKQHGCCPGVSQWQQEGCAPCLAIHPSQASSRCASSGADPTFGNRCSVSGAQAATAPAPAGAGQEPVALCVKAGTAIVTSDRVLHCSGANRSRHTRRAWMPQFSAGPITWRDSGVPVGLAIPLHPPPCGAAGDRR